MKFARCRNPAAVSMAFLCLAAVAPAADEWGTIEGQFVFEGDIPELKPLITKGDAGVKDAPVCAVNGVPDETLIIDPESRGIANIFLYIRKAPKQIHPDLKNSAEKEVVFDQAGCKFLPHTLILRTDQTILVKSGDPISHNTHTHPFRYKSENLVISANDRKGVPLQIKESQLATPPVKVTCDIHPHMIAWWMVSDHPYVAITDSYGKFKIENLPAGEHEFRVWHEKLLYVNCAEFKRDWKITVEGGKSTTLPTITLSAASIPQQ
jgi:hypothetical protein